MDSNSVGFFASLGSLAFIDEALGSLIWQNVEFLLISIVFFVVFYRWIFQLLRESNTGRAMLLILASLFSVLSATWIILCILQANLWLLISAGIFMINVYALVKYSLVR